MAEHPELWTESTPERRYLFDRPPTFGLARDAERLPLEVPPTPPLADSRKPRREQGPFLTYLRLPWSYSDDTSGERWHRMRCWLGRHEMAGGQTVHLAGTVVFIERRCRWCAAEAGASQGSSR